jgi:hypothetical protein
LRTHAFHQPLPRGWTAFVFGIGLALWKAGVLVPPARVAIGAVVAIGIGIMILVSSGKPTVTKDT